MSSLETGRRRVFNPEDYGRGGILRPEESTSHRRSGTLHQESKPVHHTDKNQRTVLKDPNRPITSWQEENDQD
jgi:hypothetical protein